MKLISSEKINLIKSKVNIITVISNYLSVKKRGKNYWVICPFHQDSNPSMSISQEKQIYYCFSCSESGNVFTFLQKYENISFIESLRKVSEMANITLDELLDYQKKIKYNKNDQIIFEINNLISFYFSNNLLTKKGYEAKKYLTKRNINNFEIELFQIGYAENSFNNLFKFLNKKGYSINQIQQTGLIVIKKGKVYDYFNNRIIFPIKNENNFIVGFSGRTIEINNYSVKYLNIPETKIFKKEQLLYNINRAKPFIIKQNKIILLEGYMDVISLEKINIKNIVALMGTNLSNYHLKEIKKITKECLIFFDGDNSGVNASLKIAIKLLNNNLNVKIVFNETQKDPDELVNDEKGEIIKKMLVTAKQPINFAFDYFKNKFNLEIANELSEFINIIGSLIIASSNIIEKELAINNLIKITGISKETIIKKIMEIRINKKNIMDLNIFDFKFKTTIYKNNNKQQKIIINKKNSLFVKETKYKIKNLKRYILAEEKMLLQLLVSRKAVKFYQEKIRNFNFNEYRLLANNIICYYNKYLEAKSVNINILYNKLNEQNLKKILIFIINKSNIKIKYNEKELIDYAILINDFAGENEIAMLWKKLEKEDNLIKKQEISIEIDKLNQRLKFKKG